MKNNCQEASWVDSYYESLEFFYWEPQHLGRKKHVSSRLDTAPKVKEHLRKMEVTLNQNLHQFFLLTPDAFRQDLLGEIFGFAIDGPMTLWGRNADDDLQLKGATQPDLFFTSQRHTVSIEMKIGSKSSVEQVLKYALIGLAAEQHFGNEMRHCLAFLGVGEFVDQWKEKFASVANLRQALLSVDAEQFVTQKAKQMRERGPRYSEIVSTMSIAFLSYGELVRRMLHRIPPEAEKSPGAEVYRKLIEGMVAEIRRRRLAE